MRKRQLSRRSLLVRAAVLAAAASASASAVACGPRVRRIGYMAGVGLDAEDAAFVSKLREFGWVEGDGLVIERRFYDGRPETMATQVTELLDLQVEVMVTFGSIPTAAAKAATNTVPIVMLGVVDPVGLGLVSNLARPEANLTGNTYGAPNMASKQLELLRDVAGGASRIAFLWNPDSPGNRGNAREHQAAATDMGIDLVDVPVRTAADIAPAIASMQTMQLDAMRVLSDPVFNTYKPQWLSFAATQQLPGMYQQLDWVAEGGLMAYVADNVDLARGGAYYVDRILRGTKPSALPIAQPTSFEFQMNVATAQRLGIQIQPEIALQVTKWF